MLAPLHNERGKGTLEAAIRPGGIVTPHKYQPLNGRGEDARLGQTAHQNVPQRRMDAGNALHVFRHGQASCETLERSRASPAPAFFPCSDPSTKADA